MDLSQTKLPARLASDFPQLDGTLLSAILDNRAQVVTVFFDQKLIRGAVLIDLFGSTALAPIREPPLPLLPPFSPLPLPPPSPSSEGG